MTGKHRRRYGVVGTSAAVMLAGLLFLVTVPAFAVHNLEFQLEGNTTDDASAAADFDWESFFTNNADNDNKGKRSVTLPHSSRPGFTASGFKDDFDLPDHSTFATGSKDTLDIDTGWQCKRSNNVGDKVDIVNAYSVVYTAGNGDTILYFGVEKSSPNGDSNIAVWFLKDGTVGCDAAGGGAESFTGEHQDGDLLVVSAFTNGGTQANVAAYAWQSGALDPDPVATGGLCAAAGTADPTGQNACAVTNSSASISPPWAHPDKNGDDLDPLEFFEGGVNLTAAGIGNACFARFLANTRSSQSLTATIFDFAAGELQLCAPSTDLAITTTPSTPTVHRGDNVTITFSEANDGINTLNPPTPSNTANGGYITTDNASCTPSHVDTNGSSTLPINDGDTGGANSLNADNGKLDPGETWLFSCTLSNIQAGVTIEALGHGIDPLGRDVTYVYEANLPCVNATARLCDADEWAKVTITVLAPSTILTYTAGAVITYYYDEQNDGNAELTKPSGGWVTDDNCSPVAEVTHSVEVGGVTVVRNTGDTDNDEKLDGGETFHFTCTKTVTAGSNLGPYTSTAVGHGIDPLGHDVTFCPYSDVTPALTRCDPDEADRISVELTHLAGPSPVPSPTPSATP